MEEFHTYLVMSLGLRMRRKFEFVLTVFNDCEVTPVSNRTSDECMKSNQDHQKCRVQCTSGVFCWVHERSECTCKTRKYALCTLHFWWSRFDSSTNYVCNCECVPTRWSTNVLSVSVQAFGYNLHHMVQFSSSDPECNSYKINLSTKRCWSSYVLALVHCTLHRADLKVVCLYSHWEHFTPLSGDTTWGELYISNGIGLSVWRR